MHVCNYSPKNFTDRILRKIKFKEEGRGIVALMYDLQHIGFFVSF